MSEYHVKFIASDNGGPRYEHIIKSYEGVAAEEGFEVFSALFGDGKGRYEDVTDIVRGWGRNWPENWEEVLYATRGRPRSVGDILVHVGADVGDRVDNYPAKELAMLTIHKAYYGIGDSPDKHIDVTTHLQSLVKDSSLDIIANNSTLVPGQNPFRGQKKTLRVRYSIDGGPEEVRLVEEKDWLIIGPALSATGQSDDFRECVSNFQPPIVDDDDPRLKTTDYLLRTDGEKAEIVPNAEKAVPNLWPKSISHPPQTAPALNDYLIRKFSISPQRLRGPMPIELRDFHRNDLAQLFAELGFKRGAEIGVAEGNYSEVICKANPEVELYCIDPWDSYDANPQKKTSERHEFAYNETQRKLKDYNARLIRKSSIDAEREFDSGTLDFVYIDGNHLFDFVMLDLIMWSNKVRSGGIVSGDDYYALDQKRWVGGGVVEAVQAYVNAHRIPIWYIFQGHKSTDFMWVKP